MTMLETVNVNRVDLKVAITKTMLKDLCMSLNAITCVPVTIDEGIECAIRWLV